MKKTKKRHLRAKISETDKLLGYPEKHPIEEERFFMDVLNKIRDDKQATGL
jgi:hypothetical protein